MNGWKPARAVARIALAVIVGVLSACATAPNAPRQEMSILDTLDNHQQLGPTSCAALNASAICEKSTRLGSTRNCGCVDAAALTDGTAFRF